MILFLQSFLEFASFLLLFICLFFLAKTINEIVTPFNIAQEIIKKNNSAFAFTLCGYYLGVIIIFIGAYSLPTTHRNFPTDIEQIAELAFLGFIIFCTLRIINNKIIFSFFGNGDDIVDQKNSALAAIQFALYIGTALIIACSTYRFYNVPKTLIYSCLLGQAAFYALVIFYQFLTPYRLREELSENNLAAGISYAGTIMAIAIVLMQGLTTHQKDSEINILKFTIIALSAGIIFPLLKLFLVRFSLTEVSPTWGVKNSGNVGAGLLEMVLTLGTALIIYFLFNRWS